MFGLLIDLTHADCTRLIQNLVTKKYLAEDTVVNRHNIFASSSYIKLGERASDIIINNQMFMFSIKKESKKQLTTKVNKRRIAASYFDDNLMECDDLDQLFDQDYFVDDSCEDRPQKKQIKSKTTKSTSNTNKKAKTYKRLTTKRTGTTSKQSSSKTSKYFGKTKSLNKNYRAFDDSASSYANDYQSTMTDYFDDDGYIIIPD